MYISYSRFIAALNLIIYAKRTANIVEGDMIELDEIDHLVSFNDGFTECLRHWPELTEKYILESMSVISMFALEFIPFERRDDILTR